MANKFWSLTHPDTLRGMAEWDENVHLEGVKCPVTRTHNSGGRRATDLNVLLTSTRITDFVWTWYHECLIQDRVLTLFKEEGFTGFDVKPVKSARMKIKAKKPDPCDSNPGVKAADAAAVEIPNFWELLITGWGGVALEESGVRLKRSCQACGMKLYNGITNASLLVDEKNWDGSDFFIVWPYPKYIFVTARVASFIKKHKLTGARFQSLNDIEFFDIAMPGRLSYYFPEERAKEIGEPLGIY